MLSVGGLELGVGGSGAVGASQRVMLADPNRLAGAVAGAAVPERTVAAGDAEVDLTAVVDRPGNAVRAGSGAGLLVDGEVVDE